MKISEAIEALKNIKKEHGDIELVRYDCEWGYGIKNGFKVVEDITIENIFEDKIVAEYKKAVV